MQPRNGQKKAPQVPNAKTPPHFQIVKLEPRITPQEVTPVPIFSPGRHLNHNETLVRDSAKTQKTQAPRKGGKTRFHIMKLEERIAPITDVQHTNVKRQSIGLCW